MATYCHVAIPKRAATPAAAPPIQAGQPCWTMHSMAVAQPQNFAGLRRVNPWRTVSPVAIV